MGFKRSRRNGCVKQLFKPTRGPRCNGYGLLLGHGCLVASGKGTVSLRTKKNLLQNRDGAKDVKNNKLGTWALFHFLNSNHWGLGTLSITLQGKLWSNMSWAPFGNIIKKRFMYFPPWVFCQSHRDMLWFVKKQAVGFKQSRQNGWFKQLFKPTRGPRCNGYGLLLGHGCLAAIGKGTVSLRTKKNLLQTPDEAKDVKNNKLGTWALFHFLNSNQWGLGTLSITLQGKLWSNMSWAPFGTIIKKRFMYFPPWDILPKSSWYAMICEEGGCGFQTVKAKWMVQAIVQTNSGAKMQWLRAAARPWVPCCKWKGYGIFAHQEKSAANPWWSKRRKKQQVGHLSPFPFSQFQPLRVGHPVNYPSRKAMVKHELGTFWYYHKKNGSCIFPHGYSAKVIVICYNLRRRRLWVSNGQGEMAASSNCSNQLGGQDAMATGCCSAMGALLQVERVRYLCAPRKICCKPLMKQKT